MEQVVEAVLVVLVSADHPLPAERRDLDSLLASRALRSIAVVAVVLAPTRAPPAPAHWVV